MKFIQNGSLEPGTVAGSGGGRKHRRGRNRGSCFRFKGGRRRRGACAVRQQRAAAERNAREEEGL